MASPSSTTRSTRRSLLRHVLTCLGLAIYCALSVEVLSAQTVLPPGFQDSVVLQGLQLPTAVAFASDGRVFVAEKSGVVKVFAGLGDTTPAVFADLRTEVNDYGDRGLLGLALDPDFPARPYVYVLYTRDAVPGGTTPTWGRPGIDGDPCPDDISGCVVTGRLARLIADQSMWTGHMDVLLDGWTQQFNSHSVGALVFGPDGALYASGGDGASWQFVDYGQSGSPLNPAGDPPAGVGGVMTPPTAEGGALRAQDLRTEGDPVGLSGAVIRVDPSTGEAFPGNPLWNHPDPNARRIVAYGFRNPFRMAFRPGTSQLWVGDVGWRSIEEINVVAEPGAGSAVNFGWPCYEGSAPQPGYQAAGLNICERLYEEPGAVTPPHFQYARGGFVRPADDSCGNANAVISGLAFYESGSYPDAYRGVLFFADYTRQCIWTLHPGPDGTPSAQDARNFATGAAFPVDLKQGPGGDIFYVDILGGTVHRIEYATTRPRATLQISPTFGAAPLLVLLDAQGSTDPEGAPLTYEWDLDGDGTFETGEVSRSHVFATDGTYRIYLRVTNDAGGSDVASGEVVVGTSAPTAVIDAPAPGLLWRAGRAYAFSGFGVDPQDGPLAPERLDWTLVLHHCSAPESCHAHPIQRFSGVASGSFVGPEHEYPSYLTIELTATDNDGYQHRLERRIDPEPLQVVVRSEPEGLRVTFGDEVLSGGAGRTVIAGSRQTVSAPSPQTIGGVTYVFSSWSDGGAQTHLAAFDAEATLTARFTPLALVLPADWTAADVGDTGLSGSAMVANDIFVLQGAGDDVWQTADAFQYAWRTLHGDGSITAYVSSFDGDHPWSKAGVMIRGSLAADAAHGFLLLSAANGTAFQRRRAAGSFTTHTAGTSFHWLRLERTGDLLTASISADGHAWLLVDRDTVALPQDVLIGLAVTSHDRTRIATAAFSSVVLTAASVGSAWPGVDVGSTGASGGVAEQDDHIVVSGSGADVWETEDAFHFAYRLYTGDLDVMVRVTPITVTDPWAKFGIMVRHSLQPDSVHAFLLLSGSEGVAFQRRQVAGGYTWHSDGGAADTSEWLRLVRVGNRFTAFRSADGVSWMPFAEEAIDMGASVLVGLAVTSHVFGALAVASFDHMSVGVGSAAWESTDVGTVIPGVTSEPAAGSLVLIGGGADIWGDSDAFRYAYRRINGDGEIVARLASLVGPHRWTKLGVMIRESLAPESPHGFLLVSSSRGIAFQRRQAFGAASIGSPQVDGTAPTWVRLVREGARLSAYRSDDGASWVYVDSDSIPMSDTVLIGVALTSHDASDLATGAVDSIQITGH